MFKVEEGAFPDALISDASRLALDAGASAMTPGSLSDLGWGRVSSFPPPRLSGGAGPSTRRDVDRVLDCYFAVGGARAATIASSELALLGVTISTFRAVMLPAFVGRLAGRLSGEAERQRFLELIDAISDAASSS